MESSYGTKKVAFIPTLIACCMKSMAIRSPNSSPAIRVNRLMNEQAPSIARKNSRTAVHTQTLHKTSKQAETMPQLYQSETEFSTAMTSVTYQPVQARNRLRPRSGLSLAKLNMKVYMSTVGSATPRISRGCPPRMEWIMPHRAVDANVCTAVRTPSAQKKFDA